MSDTTHPAGGGGQGGHEGEDRGKIGIEGHDNSCQTNALMPVSARPMSSFWIWLVPS